MLPYALSVSFIIWLVTFVVSSLNFVPTKGAVVASPGGATVSAIPHVLFTGRPVAYKDTALTFGQYVELPTYPTQYNSMAARTAPAIALYPRGTLQGSWVFFSLQTNKLVSRSRWTALPMPESVIRKMNSIANTKRRLDGDLVFHLGGEEVLTSRTRPSSTPNADAEELRAVEDALNREAAVAELEELQNDDSELSRNLPQTQEGVSTGNAAFGDILGPLVDEGIIRADDAEIVLSDRPVVNIGRGDGDPLPADDPHGVVHAGDDVSNGMEAEIQADLSSMRRETGYNLRSNRRQAGEPWRYQDRRAEEKKEEYSLQIGLKQALRSMPRAAVRATALELLQADDKGTMRGVLKKSLTLKQLKKIIRSSLFLKMKYDSSGKFDKLKARLVAGGHMQDRSLYDATETSSPTVNLSSVYMVAGIAAIEGRSVVTMDVGGAYLNADMRREVHMVLQPEVADILCRIRPKYEEYLNDDGSIIVKLEKALYGLIESSELWYRKLTGDLKSIGFKPNVKDPCVLNCDYKGAQLTVTVYVDDIMATCVHPDGLDWLHQQLEKIYPIVSIRKGTTHSYLGQTFDFKVKGKVKITMEGYVNDLLSLYLSGGVAATPATNDLFKISEDSEQLSVEKSSEFRTVVAKFLYLAKRARPDLLLATSFLASRVKDPREEDQKKLARMLRYLEGTKHLGIVLEANKPIQLTAYVDASYAVHDNFKSQTGGIISLGRGPVFANSSKQKLVSKSSTEAELIGVSDVLSHVLWARDFLLEQGHEIGSAKLYQDNTSTILLAQKGLSSSGKTRHVGVRYFFIKDRIDAGEVVVSHVSTTEMIADVLTKPLQGNLFRTLREHLLNWRED